jgi:hypothetical protein
MEKISLTAIQWGILVIFLISAVIAAPNVSESQKTNNQVPPATSSNASTSSTTATPDNKSQGNSTDQVIIYFTFLGRYGTRNVLFLGLKIRISKKCLHFRDSLHIRRHRMYGRTFSDVQENSFTRPAV